MRRTNSKHFESTAGRGMLLKSLETACLYIPVKLLPGSKGALIGVQVLAKVASTALIFVFFNALV